MCVCVHTLWCIVPHDATCLKVVSAQAWAPYLHTKLHFFLQISLWNTDTHTIALCVFVWWLKHFVAGFWWLAATRWSISFVRTPIQWDSSSPLFLRWDWSSDREVFSSQTKAVHSQDGQEKCQCFCIKSMQGDWLMLKLFCMALHGTAWHWLVRLGPLEWASCLREHHSRYGHYATAASFGTIHWAGRGREEDGALLRWCCDAWLSVSMF